MCGRTRVTLAPEEVLRAASASRWIDQDAYEPSHNVSPGSRPTPVVRQAEGGEVVVQSMTWGLVPSFTPDQQPDFFKMFNARSESVSERPAFRRLVPTRRAVALVDGFYEWKKEGVGSRRKQPYYVHLAGGEPLALAALWDTWHRPDGATLHTYTILTADASPRLQWLHDRMPVILRDKEAQRLWLDVSDPESATRVHKVLGSYNGEDLQWHAVTPAMGTPSFQRPEASAPLAKPSAADFFKPRKPGAASPGVKSPPSQAGTGAEGSGSGSAAPSEQAAPALNPDESPGPRQRARAGAEAEAATPSTAPALKREEGEGEEPAGRSSGSTPLKRKAGGSAATQPPGGSPSPAHRDKKARPPGQQELTKFFKKAGG